MESSSTSYLLLSGTEDGGGSDALTNVMGLLVNRERPCSVVVENIGLFGGPSSFLSLDGSTSGEATRAAIGGYGNEGDSERRVRAAS